MLPTVGADVSHPLLSLVCLASLAALLPACGDGGDSSAEVPASPAVTDATAGDLGTTAPVDGDDGGALPTAPGADDGGRLRIDEVATGLDVPWGLAFRRDGTALVTERDRGRLLAIDGNDVRVVRTIDVDAAGEGGLLGVAVPPAGVADGYVYVYYTTSRDNRVVRFRDDGDLQEVVTGIPAARVHDGGRIAFGPDGMLYIATGDARAGERAQQRNSFGGKILRVAPNGSVPPDNPFAGSPVWSLGHRNVQGLGWTSDGVLYAAEFGPDRDDEINRIRPGGNYGWPLVTGRSDDQRFIDPVLVRQPPEASWSGMAVPTSSQVPAWDGDLLVASLRGQRLWHVQLAADGTVERADDLLVDRYGRLRLAAQAPDGSIWIMTSNRDGRGDPAPGDDRILRITSADG